MITCNKKTNREGFTLAELLVVVAIIAIIVAVSIPIFTGKLSEAKKNTDLANIRAAKAAAIYDYLQNQEDYQTRTYAKFYDAENSTMKEDPVPIKPYSQEATNNQVAHLKTGILLMTIEYPQGADELIVNHEWFFMGDSWHK